MQLSNTLGHLTYSTLVHAGDNWDQMRASVEEFVPQVKKRLGVEGKFGVSLRISGDSQKTLSESPDARSDLKRFLDNQGLYVFTINAFPYGPFKGQRVMERVYEPDWTTNQRVEYTKAIADILVDITDADTSPSIQTAPLAFAPNVSDENYISRFTTSVFEVLAHLYHLEARTGRRVKLSIEPEPACYLETTDETVAFFTERMYAPAGVAELANIAQIPLSEAEGAIKRYLGIVFDIGHQSVGFEDIPQSLEKLVNAGIPIFKLQEAAALWVESLSLDIVPELRRFTDTIYLSQTSLKTAGGIVKYLNLGEALDAYEANPVPTEMRTHFHVPVFLEEIGPFKTTRFAVQQALAMHRKQPLSDHLEIETYTWDVLPAELKTGDIVDYVSRELEFVMKELQS
ncbi:metabolite traffic protein EboE [Aquiluna sp.]|nr:metabolite traffic protein EboE [Aquiluna sp.]MDA8901869.1 metabolite traffic protein EboE [Aquiluna sp.]MDA8992941.1 metabolite traffic protein EboE [Aquiluna sp.]